ncbi:MAG: D-cysteine desulfhydrase family protein [Proteobacteria bacterium]|nr:D-cysteine desulfhydrase family protein [Pseudomonadota bacterium]
MNINWPARIPLGYFPTPLEPLGRLSRQLAGPQIYLKRDDQTGLATGGNKTRKLEFILADAVARGADRLITLGGPQSNHCRQTAAAAARMGMECSVVLRGNPPPQSLGNLLLDDLLGAEIRWAGSETREAVADSLVAGLRAVGQRPYLVPLGGSTPLGACGYVRAMQEALQQLAEQRIDIDTMVLASSSGGTQAGLVLGALLGGYRGRILGISIDSPQAQLSAMVHEIAFGAAELLGAPSADPAGRIDVNADYLGGGYAVVGDLERHAIRVAARSEGLLLDPVYTGRAFGALLDLIERKVIDRRERVLFWHTGGAAALSAFSAELSPR